MSLQNLYRHKLQSRLTKDSAMVVNNLSSSAFIGEIRCVSFNEVPEGWALCDGSLILIEDNRPLFSVLGVSFGGNGTTNFALPDLRGRFILGVGNSDGVPNVTLGQKGGQASVSAPTTDAETGATSVAIAFTGNSIPTVPPYLALNFIISTKGITP